MSERNLEVVRRGLAAFNEGNLDVLSELADPSYEWHTAKELPGSRVARGLEDVRDFMDEFLEQWDEYRLDVDRVIDAGDDLVLVLGRVEAIGVGSGVPLKTPVAYLSTLRDGKLVRTQVFLDQRAAAAEAGVDLT
jgi:ketosteroid isomerase-like protein